jgi:hypothetical protein
MYCTQHVIYTCVGRGGDGGLRDHFLGTIHILYIMRSHGNVMRIMMVSDYIAKGILL